MKEKFDRYQTATNNTFSDMSLRLITVNEKFEPLNDKIHSL